MSIEAIKEKLFESLSACSFFQEIDKQCGGINEKTSLINDIKIESIQLLEYIIQIEKHIGQTIDFDDLAIESFDTIEILANEINKLGILV